MTSRTVEMGSSIIFVPCIDTGIISEEFTVLDNRHVW